MAYVEGFVIPVQETNRAQFIAVIEAIDALFLELGATGVVEWPDKATRDACHAKMGELMETDPRMRDNTMPFDGKRMIFGGFTPVVDIPARAAPTTMIGETL